MCMCWAGGGGGANPGGRSVAPSFIQSLAILYELRICAQETGFIPKCVNLQHDLIPFKTTWLAIGFVYVHS